MANNLNYLQLQDDKMIRISSYSVVYSHLFHLLSTFLLSRLRELRTRLVGRLSSICGTITRSSEVRPELLFGNFTCLDCNKEIKDVEQQFRYTEVLE
jgi:DNA replication licensing factor MCM6